MLAQQVFTLTYSHTMAVIIGFGIMCVPSLGPPIRRSDSVSFSGSAPVAFVAMLGPRFGLRTMVITRYSFGYSGAAVISILNIMTQVRRDCYRWEKYTFQFSIYSCDAIQLIHGFFVPCDTVQRSAFPYLGQLFQARFSTT